MIAVPFKAVRQAIGLLTPKKRALISTLDREITNLKQNRMLWKAADKR